MLFQVEGQHEQRPRGWKLRGILPELSRREEKGQKKLENTAGPKIIKGLLFQKEFACNCPTSISPRKLGSHELHL